MTSIWDKPWTPLFRISSKLDTSLFLAVRSDKVILATSDPSNHSQQWYKYETEDGSRFACVNKATNQAIKQPADLQPLELIPYSSLKDVAILWTENTIVNGDGYALIQMADKPSQAWDVEKAIAKDGTPILCWESNKQINQQWIMYPSVSLPPAPQLVKIYTKAGPDFSLTIRDGKVVLAKPNPYDKLQQWYKLDASTPVNEDEGYACYMWVNRKTGQVIKKSDTPDGYYLELIRSDSTGNEAVAWTEQSFQNGYKTIKSVRSSDEYRYFQSFRNLGEDNVRAQSFRWNGGKGNWWIPALCGPPLVSIPVRLYCKGKLDSCITIKNGKVVVASSDTRDKFQLWYKVDASNQVDNDYQWPCFALVNVASDLAIKHVTSNQTVELTRYYSNGDKSILWIERSWTDGFKSIKPINNGSLTLEALRDPSKTDVILGSSNNAATVSQRWISTPSAPIVPHITGTQATFKVYTKNSSDYVISVRDNKIVLALFNPFDNSQAWYKEIRAKDENGFPCFALINKGTGLAAKYSTAHAQPLQLVEYKPNVFEKSILWTESSLSDGYVAIGLMNDYSGWTWDGQGDAKDGVTVGCVNWHGGRNQRWKIALLQ